MSRDTAFDNPFNELAGSEVRGDERPRLVEVHCATRKDVDVHGAFRDERVDAHVTLGEEHDAGDAAPLAVDVLGELGVADATQAQAVR
jgi:hypothetical protein